MPILNVHVTAGYRSDQKIELLEKATQATINSLSVPLSNVRIVIHEINQDQVIVAGEIGKNMVIFTAYLIIGRSEEKKAALIAALNEAACNSLEISSQDVRVIIQDIPKTDMGVAGGISARQAGR